VIVAGYGPDGPVGLTATAFTSVSLSPPLVLVCIGRRSSSHDTLVSGAGFGVSILAADQVRAAEQCAHGGKDRFAGLSFRSGIDVPLVEGAIAQLECFVHALHDAGDHTVLIGEVKRASVVDRQLRSSGIETSWWELSDFVAEDVFLARTTAPAIVDFVADARRSAALVLASPVYKASYSGALKAIVDLLPPDTFVGKPALGIATVRLPAHGLLIEQAYAALFAFFSAHVLPPLVVFDEDIVSQEGTRGLNAQAASRVSDAATRLIALVGT